MQTKQTLQNLGLKILPTHKPHRNLEKEVQDYLESLGFYVHSSTYHTVMPQMTKDRLARIDSPTALYVRGRADRLAIHKQKDIVFEWEAKTYGISMLHNMALEAMPFIHHLTRSKHNVKCLYCYRDATRGYDCGFWIENHPPIYKIKLPDRWKGNIRQVFLDQFKEFLPGIPIDYIQNTYGSNDPFLIIHEDDIPSLMSWRHLIQKTVEPT